VARASRTDGTEKAPDRRKRAATPRKGARDGERLVTHGETSGRVFDMEAEADAIALAADPDRETVAAGAALPDRDVDPVDATFEVGLPPGSVIRQGDRLKAYRPIPAERRREALEAGIQAYSRGDFFEAHELLEPAWMGTADQAERELYQGLIKLAAGYVHCVRGNPIGMSRNLEGARQHLETCFGLDPSAGKAAGINLMDLLMEVEVRLKSVHVAVGHLNTNAAIMLELAEAAPRLR
jgi:hypothetical protein